MIKICEICENKYAKINLKQKVLQEFIVMTVVVNQQG